MHKSAIKANNMTPSQQYIETLKREYIENHIRQQEREELIAENNIENRDIKGYHGRELLELLQNADDAYQKSIDLGTKPGCDLVVTIKYIQNILTIANTGTFFDKDGIKAIVQGNNSPKTGKYIGNKGTGFRSILNWAQNIKIFSGDYAIEFSKTIAKQIFDQIKQQPQIAKQIQKKQDLYIPMLAVPQNIEHTHSKEYTTIEILVNQEKQKDDFSVEKQLSGIDLRILLFLPNISKISIETNNSLILYERWIKGVQPKTVLLRKTVNNIVETEESFTLFEKIIPRAIREDGALKDIQLSIAVPDQKLRIPNHIYSYFPLLETDSPFNCILHATYALGDHRNNINTSDANKRIIQEQLSFLLDVAKYYVKKDNFSKAYQILIPSNYITGDWHFSSTYSKFNLEKYYIKLLKNEKLFLTVNGKLISINEGPKYIDSPFPKVFSQKPFEKLLKWTDDTNRSCLIRLISDGAGIDLSFQENELCKYINQVSKKWSVSQQVDVFIWWNSKYNSSLPHLLKTQQNRWINFKDECYFLEGDFDSIELPKWVRVPAIKYNYQKSLLTKAKKKEPRITALQEDRDNGRKRSVARIISQNNIFAIVNFKYRDKSNIIPAINSSVNTYEKSVQFVKWLWLFYHSSGRELVTTDYSKISMNFPSSDGKVVDSHSLYFGDEYGNTISKYIFDDAYSAIPAPLTFSIEKNDEVEFKEFLEGFGVKDFPEIEIADIPDISLSYDKAMKQQICDSGVFKGTASYYVYYCKYQLPYINNLKNLLATLSTENVIRWLICDVNLYSHIASPYCPSQAVVSFYGNSQYNIRRYSGKIPNYILFLFNEIPWVRIDDKKYAPKQILKGYNSKNNQKFETIIPVITEQIIKDLAKQLQVQYYDVVTAIDKFAFAEKVTDLSSDAFYGLMLTLQESTNAQYQELSKIIYRIVEQSSFDKEFEQSKNKELFLKQGKLLVKYQGKIQYYPAIESFLPSTKIINKKDFPIVEKGQRTNNSNFVRLFGCKEYENDDTVIKGSEVISSTNEQFQNYFIDFQKYAKAYGDQNENIEKNANRLKVILVEQIDILEKDVRITICDNYSLVKDTISNWFIVFHDNHIDINVLSELIENIYANIANTPGFDAGKIGELFRAKSKELREFLIKKEFGSLEVINDERYKNAVKQNFQETIKSINPTIDIDNLQIDFDNFSAQTNCPLIIDLLSKLSIDINDFEKAGFVYPINLKDYFASSLELFIRKEFTSFKDVQYCKALANKRLQDNFINIIDDFESYPQNAEITNSISYNFESELIAKFGEWRTSPCNKSADKEYSSNYERMNPNQMYEDIIANDRNLQKMFYFGLDEEFKKWVQTQQAAEALAKTNSRTDKYSRYRNIVPDITEISFNEEKRDDNLHKLYVKHKGTYTHTKTSKTETNLKEIGNCGELLVYNLLCQLYGVDNVFPRSEAYVELGIIKPGKAVSGDYDISYKDAAGNETFIEVKTGSENRFYMTPSELQFAKRHADSYRVYYVRDIKSMSPKCTILTCKFWEDPLYRMTEIVEKIEVDF